MSIVDIKKEKKKPSKKMVQQRGDLHGIDVQMTVTIGHTEIGYDVGMHITQDLLVAASDAGKVSTSRALYYTLGRMLTRLLADDDDRYELETALKKGLSCRMLPSNHHSLKHHISQVTHSPTLSQLKQERQDA